MTGCSQRKSAAPEFLTPPARLIPPPVPDVIPSYDDPLNSLFPCPDADKISTSQVQRSTSGSVSVRSMGRSLTDLWWVFSCGGIRGVTEDRDDGDEVYVGFFGCPLSLATSRSNTSMRWINWWLMLISCSITFKASGSVRIAAMASCMVGRLTHLLYQTMTGYASIGWIRYLPAGIVETSNFDMHNISVLKPCGILCPDYMQGIFSNVRIYD